MHLTAETLPVTKTLYFPIHDLHCRIKVSLASNCKQTGTRVYSHFGNAALAACYVLQRVTQMLRVLNDPR